jgi:hypothetical protein
MQAPPEACVPFDGGAGGDGGDGGDGGTSTMYDRLGGHACIRELVTGIITESLKDPQLASYFVLNVPCTRPGHPTANQLIGCFTNLIGSATGGPEAYPATVGGWTCRSMAASHANLHIPTDAFNKFVTAADGVAVSSGSISQSDLATLGALLGTTRADIVDPQAPAGAFFDGG